MSLDLEKEKAAKEAFQFIEPDLRKDSVIGIGTGSVSYTHLTLPTTSSG